MKHSFRPLPLLGNPHVQTILGNLLGGQVSNNMREQVVTLPDGDRIVLHETPPAAEREDAPIAVLIHGLGGCHRSGYMQRMTGRLHGLDWRVFGMDLRAAGAGLTLARRFYNAACSEDVRAVLAHVAAAYPRAPMALVGFSLGGNIVLKLAGEYGEEPPPILRAVAAVAPPIDLIRCSELIARYPFYDRFYVRHLTTQVAEHARHFPDLPTIAFPRGCTLRHFDEVYTAPRWGYADALDYYRQASALPRMEAICVPTFVLTARDDPFIAVEPFETLPKIPSVEIHVANHGGHLGFLGADGNGGVRWAETQIIRWLANRLQPLASR